jgi:uncharacterized protein YdhG (YjbR/CyaY superfamily)
VPRKDGRIHGIAGEHRMKKISFRSVDEYIALQPGQAQRVLRHLRSIVQKAVPDAEETISYNIPACKLHGERMLFFAGWKHHYSLYPATQGVTDTFRDELAPYQVSKGTIRFPLGEPVPTKLIERIVKFRAKEIASGGKPRSKPGRQKKPSRKRAR